MYREKPITPSNVTWAGGRETSNFEIYGTGVFVFATIFLLAFAINELHKRKIHERFAAATERYFPALAGVAVAVVIFAGGAYIYPRAAHYALLVVASALLLVGPLFIGLWVYSRLRRR